jgi:predicted deacylase
MVRTNRSNIASDPILNESSLSPGADAATSIPVAVIRGSKPGPVPALVSGLHGTEYASIIALEKVIQARSTVL